MLYFSTKKSVFFREKGKNPLTLVLGIAGVTLAQAAVGTQTRYLAFLLLDKQVTLGIWYRPLAIITLDIT
jgi:hypothetical protein